jgi:hypothetical protein
MPFFAVTKGQDAFVAYVTIIEADDPKQALQQAESWEFSGTWRPTGTISEFDHFETFEDCVNQVDAESLEEAEAKLDTASPPSAMPNVVRVGPPAIANIRRFPLPRASPAEFCRHHAVRMTLRARRRSLYLLAP